MNVSATQHPLASGSPAGESAISPSTPEDQQLDEATRQFEAVFLRQMLQQMRKPLFKSDFVSDSATSGIYQDLVNTQLADSMSQSGGLGLARQLKVQLQRQLSAPAAAEPPPAQNLNHESSESVPNHDRNN